LCCVVAASSFFFSFEVSYPSSSIAVCLWLLLLVLLIDCVFLGVHCVCLLLHWHFLRVFIVFFLVFYENEAYRLAIHIWFFIKKLWVLLVKSHTNCQSIWLVFLKEIYVIRIDNSYAFFLKKKFSYGLTIHIAFFLKKKFVIRIAVWLFFLIFFPSYGLSIRIAFFLKKKIVIQIVNPYGFFLKDFLS